MVLHRFVASIALLAAVLVGCSSDDPVTSTSNVTVTCRIDNAVTSSVGGKGPAVAGDVVDSLMVTRVRVLVKRLILHPSASNDSTDDRSVKNGPFLLVADSTGSRVVAQAQLTPGSYDKLKFEMHRFSSSEIPSYQNDTIYRDFVTGSRYSVIIDGIVVRNGTRSAFQYESDITSNVEFSLPSFVVPQSGSTTLALVFAGAGAFLDKGQLLDPRDPKNESEIDNKIKAAFRLNP